MKSIYRLKKNYQYNYVYKHAESVADKLLVMLYCKSNGRQTKVGFSVGKKYGHAVERNKIRRKLKAAAETLMPQVKDGYNIIFVPRLRENYDYWQILDGMQKLLHRAGLAR
ncbi:MAG: ribonuclease P protein component [Corallococcus sp.]|nr:ribonuclease P protein component [Corallococcus sp.]MCM1359970.1 ribonuclease P protein component [Corallococcus sp.]MCM1395526.1 ribonuclease P protein component [Corallococcus sp.]